MQLNTYVDGRLNRWGAWYHAQARPGPKAVRSQMAGILAKAGDGEIRARVVFDNSEALETDAAVYRLRDIERGLFDAVIEYWIKSGTVEQKARALGIQPRAFYYRLDRAKLQLLGIFNDIAAGLPFGAPADVEDRPQKIA